VPPIDGDEEVLRFGNFELDTHAGELRRAGVLIKLTPQQLKLLHYLVVHPGQILGREEIQREIWGSDTVVEFDRNLNVCIAQLRSVLNDDSGSPRFIETVPKRGYRFVAPVVRPQKPKDALPPSLPRRWLLAVGLTAVVSAVVAVLVFARNPHSVRDVRVAVLPFENLTGDANDEPVVAGLTDELISAFGSVQPARLGVIGRSSVMRYKNSRPALDQIAREMQVRYVVEGTLRKDAGRVRIAARLIRVGDQVQIWTDTFEQDESNMFEMQEDAAARITAAVLLRLFPSSGETVKAARRHSREALEAYTNGRFLQHKGNLADLNRSVTFFEQATKNDPSFSEAYAALAETCLALAISGRDPAESFARAKTAAESALRSDESNAEAQNAIANVLFWHEWNWPEAERHFSRAIDINPSFALAQHDYAYFLVAMGRTEAGLGSWRRAVAIDPLSTRVNIDGGWLLLQAHRFDDAIRQAQRALELSPGLAEANACIARARQYQGRADPETDKQLRALMDNPGAAEPFTYATACALLGENSKALDGLDRAYAARSTMMTMLKTEPSFTRLHGDTRFEALVLKMRLP
jgi:TolB-like protein/DNA-binding winged helix-turn-helix (wHTH) protein/Tfp pilus assembly protein PilF